MEIVEQVCINIRYFREEMNILSSMRRMYHHFSFIHCRLFCYEAKHTIFVVFREICSVIFKAFQLKFVH
jgi:hypothetical protein